MKELILKPKLEVDYEYIENILRVKDTAIINCEYILMDIKPYRRSIFLQIYGKKNEFQKTWKILDFKQKMNWIETVLLPKYEKDEFIEHLLKAISMFSRREDVLKSFYMALEVDLKEGNENV